MASEVPNNGPFIIGVTWWLCFFCGGFLTIRLYAKISRHQWLWWDDYVLIFSWTMFFIESIITQLGTNLGFGKHYYNIPSANLLTIALYTSIGASISCFASTGSKISWGISLLRLTEGYCEVFVWFAIVTLFMVMIPSALLTWIQCTPIEKVWNTYVAGRCLDASIPVNYGIFNAAWCAVMDFALALLPWKLIWKLQMRTKEKIGVGIAMSLGILSGVCAIVKGVYMVELRQQDFYFNGKDLAIWTAVETATAIIAASLPVFRALLKEAISTRSNNAGSDEMPLAHLTNVLRTIGGTPLKSRRRSLKMWSKPASRGTDPGSDTGTLSDKTDDAVPGMWQTRILAAESARASV
ncbi:uncharacterized protein BCR38DRAFT_525971 [Pseudomassariella vexata]|uniref:Rhodopsin domain-containing protein n=1 Tax=Pseudomassariella vexata TaxID=1141098 RepID=A0A1Y2DQN7_9PEZI|nr:uncharacterized protein BCR38DRAFT_525971 [Pseudomassariella vexata]ORY61612.1 hypothetical protein BCR38DRAFT_525971 [Pseudomassariella vexata]